MHDLGDSNELTSALAVCSREAGVVIMITAVYKLDYMF
jgi:hypothetical protein